MTEYGRNGPFLAGTRLLEQYEVVRLLGTGGHAYVYECRDLFLDEHLAIKVIPNPPNRGRELLDRARAEAQLLRRLSHPNVVRMHTAAALGEDMVCLVMEKLDGISVRHLLSLLGRLSVVEAATIVRQIAVGVAAAHELNVVHRDIKPDNAFVLPPNNHVKVLDFGIAKFLGHGLQTSNKYRFQGTPLYMSPEHLKGAGVTARSDVYQLGTVLFELVAGINPNLIDLDDPGFEQVAFVQITRPTPALTRVLPDAPTDLDWLVQKATEKDPDARFASMKEFINALDAVMHAHVTAHPDEAHRFRYVDAALMQAAKELAAREDSYAWDGHTDTVPPAPRHFDSTLAMGEPTTAPLDAHIETDEMVSFHPVPQMLGQAAVPIPKLRPVIVEPAKSAESARKPLSLAFIAAALGFGVVVGLLLLWLRPRSNAANQATSSAAESATVVATAPSAVAAPSVAPSTSLAAPVLIAAETAPPTKVTIGHASRVLTAAADGGTTPPEPKPLRTPPASATPIALPQELPSALPESAPPAADARPGEPAPAGARPRLLTGELRRRGEK
jgi:serine/threonine protein kinase